jgi:N-acetylglutamate synthase-like GNAT family acetyltransferase
MTIAAYQHNHQEMVINLILSIQREEFGIDINIEQQADLLDIEHFYQKDKGNFWVCTVDNKVVGTIALLDIGHGQAALRKMFVHREHRGKAHGIGHALFAILLKWVTDKGITEIYLGTTEDFLAAHRFYEKNGFERVPMSQLPEAFPIMKVDTVFYKKTV